MKKFIRTKEDFTCKHCGAKVAGNGYTNHCPNCLWSRHVDVNPGDRSQPCRGMMRPVKVLAARRGYIITHLCQKCAAVKRNKSAANDSFEALLAIASSVAKI